MSSKNNGICEKNTKGDRKHKWVIKKDLYGNEWRGCSECATALLKPLEIRVIEKDIC